MTTKQHWQNYIDKQWVDSSESIDIENPATTEIIGSIALANQQTVNQAVNAARRCADSGVLTECRPVVRANWLYAIAKEIRAMGNEGVELLTLENGKTLSDSQDEFDEAARYFEYYAGLTDKIEGKSIPLGKDYIDFTIIEPFGVSAQIVPWNFPVSICARSLAPALAAGNAVVIKSPELCPLAMTLLAKACERTDLPSGAVNIICGYGHEAGAALVAHTGVDQIVFTGSVATGVHIMKSAAERAIPTVMELGGKSAAVVFSDADINQLIDSVRWGIFFNAGQVCSAMSRLLVEREIYDEVINAVIQLAENQTIGAGIEQPDITPLASKNQLEQVKSICERAVQSNAKCLLGGKPTANKEGYFMDATLFSDVEPDSELFQDEIFGPVLSITPFDTEEEAWTLANQTDFGLVAGVFTQDISRAMRAASKLDAGQVFINEWYAGGIETPFGGNKRSGFGREKGVEALQSYVRTKNVAIRVNNS